MPHPASTTRPLTRGVAASLCLIVLSCLVAAGQATVADAQDPAALQARIDSARAQADRLGARIEANAAAIAGAQARANAAAEREAELTAVLDHGQARLSRLRSRVELAADEVQRIRGQLAEARELLAKRLVAIYKGAVPDATALVLEADGFEDLTTRITYLSKIQQSDQILAKRIRGLRAQAEQELAAGREARDHQAALNRQIANARRQIAGSRAAAEARAAELGQLRRTQAAAVGELRGQIDTWTEQIREIQRISAADARQEVARWFGNYSIPTGIVMCESGGNYDAVNPSSGAGGAYQIMPSTWKLYGGKGAPQDASRAEQDSIAAQIWADSGAGAWVCAQ